MPMLSVQAVQALPGKGLVGDRNFRPAGDSRPDEQLTLIETEALEALQRDYGVVLETAESRRNLATSGVALNHWVGRTFRVGAVLLRGVELCEPCAHLEKLTGKKVMKGLVHRGGLRAQILAEGEIRVGDPIGDEAES